MTSDDLQELSDDRIRLWKFLLNMDPGSCSFPLLGESPLIYERKQTFDSIQPAARLADPVIAQVRTNIHAKRDESAVFLFNTGERPVQRSYSLNALGLSAPLYIYDWIQAKPWSAPVNRIACTLDPHDGKLLLLSEKPYIEGS